MKYTIEKFIERVNQTHNFKFNNCKNIKPLPFDFYIPELNICIEFQGKQHEEVVWG